MSDHVFVDSGAFIAFLDRSDRQHPNVAALFSRKPRRWSTSTLVLAETYGWFLHRLGEDAARQFRLFTDELPQLQVLGAGTGHRRSVSDKLEALRGCKLTYVDASSLVWLEEKEHLRRLGDRSPFIPRGGQGSAGPAESVARMLAS